MTFKTPDLCDQFEADLGTSVRVVAPMFRRYGGRNAFSGRIATLKLFDYIGAGVPILALAVDNAAAAIVQAYGLGLTTAPDDATAIQHALHEIIARQATGAAWPGFAAAQQQFERRQLTGQLAAIFRKEISSCRQPSP